MNFSELGQNIKAFLARYSLQQKLGMVFAAGLVIVLTWTMVYFVNKVDFQMLYTDMDPKDAQAVVTKLQGMQVAYETSDDGRTIRVPADKHNEVVMQLAADGLPASGRIGFEIFDGTNFGVTNFQEQVNYQRALEGELARTILGLSEVSAARVHLVMAKESLYESTEDQTKASVYLKMKNGKPLPASGVQGIVHIVANAVKGLSADKVAVIDEHGKMLSRTEAENSLTGQQLDSVGKMELDLKNKIVQILEPTIGLGKVRPQVSVTMNFQQIEETQQTVDPQVSAVVSQTRSVDTVSGTTTAGGITGTRSTINPTGAPVPTPLTPTTGGGNSKQAETVNYEFSKSTRHIVNPVGKIERVSAAVMLDNQTETTTGADGKVQTKSKPRTPEEMKKYHDLVAAAIAFNAERGDTLIVENMSFENEIPPIAVPTSFEKYAPSVAPALRYLIVPIGFILIYFLFIRPVQKSVMAGWVPVTANSQLTRGSSRGGLQTPMTVKQLEARLSPDYKPGENEDSAGALESDLLPQQSASRMEHIRKRVVEQAKQDPEAVARLVRVWLNEEKNR